MHTTGVGLSKNVKTGSYIMMGTCLSYLLLQIPAIFAQLSGNSAAGVAAFQHGWSFLGNPNPNPNPSPSPNPNPNPKR